MITEQTETTLSGLAPLTQNQYDNTATNSPSHVTQRTTGTTSDFIISLKGCSVSNSQELLFSVQRNVPQTLTVSMAKGNKQLNTTLHDSPQSARRHTEYFKVSTGVDNMNSDWDLEFALDNEKSGKNGTWTFVKASVGGG